MRTTLKRTALAVGGVAAALSLSACDGVTINFGEGNEAPASAEPTADTREPTADTGNGTTDRSGAGDGSTNRSDGTRSEGAGNGAGSGSGSGGAGGSSDGSGSDGAGSDGSSSDTSQQNADFTLDEDGNGKIPVSVLEEDISQAYKDQGTQIDSVECSGDMHVWNKTGSQTCDVAVTGDRTYYGLVKVTDVVGQNVYYKLEFAGIDF